MLAYIEDFYDMLYKMDISEMIVIFYNIRDIMVGKTYWFKREDYEEDLCYNLNISKEKALIATEIPQKGKIISDIINPATIYAQNNNMFWARSAFRNNNIEMILLYKLINNSSIDYDYIAKSLYGYYIDSLNYKNSISMSNRKLVDRERDLIKKPQNRKKSNNDDKPSFGRNREDTLCNIKNVVKNFYVEKDEIIGVSLYKVNITLDSTEEIKIEWNVLMTDQGECSYSKNKNIDFNQYSSFVKTKIKEFFYSSKDRQSYNHRLPIAFKSKEGLYFVLFPCCETFGNNTFNYSMLLVHNKPIYYKIVLRISELLTDYFGNYINVEKRKFLQELQEDLLQLSFGSDNKSSMDVFEWYAKKCLNGLLNLTNSYNITMRLAKLKTRDSGNFYNEKSRDKTILELFLYVSEKSDIEKPKQFYEVGKEHDNTHSAIFCLKNSSNKAIYRKKILDIVSEKVTNPENYYPARKQTVSAFCIPLFYKTQVIGTINFESLTVNAFDDECDSCNDDIATLSQSSFILAVKKQIENYLLHLFDNSDRNYFIGLQSNTNEFHQLKNVVFTTKDLNNHLEDFKLYFSPSDKKLTSFIERKNEPVKIVTLKEDFDKYWAIHEEMLGDMADAIIKPKKQAVNFSMRNFCKDTIDEIYIIGLQYFDIVVVFQNLLSNFISHGRITGDKIDHLSFVITKIKRTSENDMNYGNDIYTKNYQIELTISLKIAEKLDEKSFFSPIFDREGKPHVGLFIVGSIVRKWGGYIYKNVDDNFSYFRIKIPILLK